MYSLEEFEEFIKDDPQFDGITDPEEKKKRIEEVHKDFLSRRKTATFTFKKFASELRK